MRLRADGLVSAARLCRGDGSAGATDGAAALLEALVEGNRGRCSGWIVQT